MPSYHILPKSPLLFRDARQFGANEQAETLAFPLPSTLSGALRTAYGDENKIDFSTQASELLNHSVAGPLLTQIDMGNQATTSVLLPAPADAIVFAEEGKAIIHRLKPGLIGEGEGTDLPQHLKPVSLVNHSQAKPEKHPPKFWWVDKMVDWLTDETLDLVDASTFGTQGLPVEHRTHIAMDNQLLTAENSKLFQTASLDFGEQRGDDADQTQWRHRYGLVVNSGIELKNNYRRIGGESRLAYIERDDTLWPVMPSALLSALKNNQCFRIQFVTPAIFKQGWLPDWLNDQLQGVMPGLNQRVQLHALALPRWQAVSGWDMLKKQHGQRPTRRMVPAGSVYWFELLSTESAAFECLWLQCLSDERSQDGFGLVVPGIWNPD